VPKHVYLLGNLVLDLTVDCALTFRELVTELTGVIDNGVAGQGRRLGGDRLREAYRRGGVLPLSRSELVRCFSDLWRSERAARDDLDKLADSPPI
jgi:hypothetical protein